jgi:hypothetical protein
MKLALPGSESIKGTVTQTRSVMVRTENVELLDAYVRIIP